MIFFNLRLGLRWLFRSFEVEISDMIWLIPYQPISFDYLTSMCAKENGFLYLTRIFCSIITIIFDMFHIGILWSAEVVTWSCKNRTHAFLIQCKIRVDKYGYHFCLPPHAPDLSNLIKNTFEIGFSYFLKKTFVFIIVFNHKSIFHSR